MEPHVRAALVAELIELMAGGNAHVPFAQACAGLAPPLRNQAVPGVPYTIWQLVEHVRIAQHDIVEFCLNPAHVSPEWPAGYWPAPAVDEAGWQAALRAIAHGQERFIDLLRDPATDLFAPLPHGTGQSVFREALLIGDHLAYHTGQLVLMQRLLGEWE